MNTILQKRIEEAASYYLLHEHKSPLNEILHQCDLKTEMQYHKDIEQTYIEGGKNSLQNQWISVDEGLPDFQQDVVVTNSKGDYWIAWRSNDNCEHKDNNGFVNYGIGEITHWAEIQKFNK